MDKNIALNCSSLLRELLTAMRRKIKPLVNDQPNPIILEVSFQPKESRFPIILAQHLAILRDCIDGLNVGSDVEYLSSNPSSKPYH